MFLYRKAINLWKEDKIHRVGETLFLLSSERALIFITYKDLKKEVIKTTQVSYGSK